MAAISKCYSNTISQIFRCQLIVSNVFYYEIIRFSSYSIFNGTWYFGYIPSTDWNCNTSLLTSKTKIALQSKLLISQEETIRLIWEDINKIYRLNNFFKTGTISCAWVGTFGGSGHSSSPPKFGSVFAPLRNDEEFNRFEGMAKLAIYKITNEITDNVLKNISRLGYDGRE